MVSEKLIKSWKSDSVQILTWYLPAEWFTLEKKY